MAADAMGLESIPCSGQSTPSVLKMSNGLQMAGVDAMSHSTKVVQLTAGRNAADQPRVCDDMTDPCNLWASGERTVPLVISCSGPQPAGSKIRADFRNRPILVDLSPEAICDGDDYSRVSIHTAASPPPCVVHTAPSAIPSSSVAVIYGTPHPDITRSYFASHRAKLTSPMSRTTAFDQKRLPAIPTRPLNADVFCQRTISMAVTVPYYHIGGHHGRNH